MAKQSLIDDFLIDNLKALLQEKLSLLEKRLQEKRMETAYKDLTEAEARILAAIRGETLTISETARRLNVSRQAVHKIISNLVKRKILKLQTVEGNARDKVICFTPAGETMKKEAYKHLLALEQEVAASIGSRNLQHLKSILRKEWC